tara:strand:- start:4121 stop:4279 length:159 start_codon:yes stop_codon:yes gene_type:complete
MSKTILLIVALIFLAGCSVFPDRTTVSASSKANNLSNPSVKASQTFKWTKKQ